MFSYELARAVQAEREREVAQRLRNASMRLERAPQRRNGSRIRRR